MVDISALAQYITVEMMITGRIVSGVQHVHHEFGDCRSNSGADSDADQRHVRHDWTR